MPPLSPPALLMTILDDLAAQRLVGEVERAGEGIEVTRKLGPREHAPAGFLPLDEARRLVAARSVCGLQLRYRLDGEEWCDTLMRLEGGWRLVRIRHQASRPGAAA